VVSLPRSLDEERIMEIAMDAGAEDLSDDGDRWVLTCPPAGLAALRQALESAGLAVDSAELSLEPSQTVTIDDEGEAKRVLRMIEAIDDHDDVQAVHANYDIADEVLAGFYG
jgi:transcriptional/translational regulatory protein YebC/TACO1